VPVIVLTTRGDEASRADALAAGANLYLTKPFAPQALAAQARALLRSQGEGA
jgi:two-component system chemotaxis response regulator CheY